MIWFSCISGEENEQAPFPYNAVIMGVVGGVFFTVLILVVCFTCRQRKREKRNRKDALRQQQQRSSIELAALRNNQSGNTTITRQNGALPNSHYVTFPRVNGSAPRETSQRTSTASSPQPPSEVSFGDQMSDSGNYKKFLTMDQYLDDDASPRTSYYGSQGGTVVTVERHPPPPSVDSGYGDMKCPTIKEDQAEVESKYKYPMLKSSGNMPYAIRETPSPLTYIGSPGKNIIGMSKLAKPDGPRLFSSFKGLEIDTSMDIEPL